MSNKFNIPCSVIELVTKFEAVPVLFGSKVVISIRKMFMLLYIEIQLNVLINMFCELKLRLW